MYKHLKNAGILCSVLILAVAFASPAFAETEDGGIMNVASVDTEAEGLLEIAAVEADALDEAKDTSAEAKEEALEESKTDMGTSIE